MAIQFDGDNLLIILESAVTEVDIVNDLYRDWKDFMLAAPLNRRFPQALLSDGGAPLTSIINQGSYIFLNNTAGWRIKPPEEDITIFLIGNLAALDIEIDTIIPTTGDFTAALIGLQPITQGVIPSMRDNLEFNTFQNEVTVDQINGTIPGITPAYVGADRVGTRRAPAGDLDTALAIAQGEGIVRINFVGPYDSVGESTDFSSGFVFSADTITDVFLIVDGLNVTNCSFDGMSIDGEVDSVNIIERCQLFTVSSHSGEIFESDLFEDVGLIGDSAKRTHIIDSYSGVEALGYPRVTDIADQPVVVRNFRGSLGLADMTGGSHSIGIYGGRLVIEASCVGGTVYARGDPYEITDLSSGAVTLINQTSSQTLIQTIPGLVWEEDPADHTNANTFGKFVKSQILTVGKFLGLK